MAESRVFRTALFLMILLQLITPAFAHPIPFSYLDLRLNQGQSQLEGTLVAHVSHLAHELNLTPPEILLDSATLELKKEAIQNLLRSHLLPTADGQPVNLELMRLEPLPDRQAVALQLRFATKAFPALLKIQCTLFTYEQEHQTFLNIYEEGLLTHQEIFDTNRTSLEYFTGSRQVALAVVKKFLLSGIYHIFAGPDHILFIVGLLLLGGSMMRLLTIVTAFTIAHSITLSLAALGLLNPSERLIEPAIALSIVYVGIDNLMVGKTDRDVRTWIAFFFGLVHGFGFAGVLREFGLPRQALGWSLFSFNFGVEIGQICIVVVAATLLAALRNRSPKLGQQVATAGSVVVILAGSYWFIQRVFF